MNGTPGPGEIALEPFREAFQRSGMSMSQIARIAQMEDTHVRRLLAGKPSTKFKNGKRYGPYVYKECSYETAVKLARAMDVDPWEVGL